MTSPPPDTADGASLLARAGEAADDHPPGLHPVEVIASARRGFTSEQGRAILDSSTLMALLTRQWATYPPTPTITQLAHGADERGHVHRELLHRAGRFLTLTTRTQYGLAAGTSGRGPETLVDGNPEQGLGVVRRIFSDQGLLDILIESNLDASNSFPVVALYAVDDDDLPTGRLLSLLVPTPAGRQAASHAESRLRMDSTLTPDRLSLFPAPIEADRLPESLLALVSHSVAVAKLPWKDAWRRAALSTPEGHPLRSAVLAGLTPHRE